MKLKPDLLRGIECSLEVLAPATRRRGRGYFVGGNVIELTCVEPDRRYSAVVRGGHDYLVTLEFAERVWQLACSCPAKYDCQHAAAALMELQERAQVNGESPATKNRARKAFLGRQAVPQPTHSPLYDRAVAKLGRELNQVEADYVRRVQSLYAESSHRKLTAFDLVGPGAAGNQVNLWQPVELWLEPPRDDFEFWLHLAWELRRLQLRHPAFLDGITDLTLIEARMMEWQHEKEIARWKDWFREFHGQSGREEQTRLELRLTLDEDEGRLQWRSSPSAQFADLKQTQAKRFAELFERGALDLAADSLPLWSATFRPWSYESWWSFKYENATARPALNRLLRLRLPPDRVVNVEGQPLPRPAEPLSLKLRTPQADQPHYQLALQTADGSPPPPILCTLEGHPTLYLTANGLYAGPPADALNEELSESIPAAALETADGLRFLHAAGLPLPEHLAARVRTVPVEVTLSCELSSVGTRTEEVRIKVGAKAPGFNAETFTPHGWQAWREPNRTPADSPRQPITIHDRRAQTHLPRVLEELGAKPSNYHGEWSFRLNKKSVEPFVTWLESLPPELDVRLDSELATLRDAPLSGKVSLEVQESALDWFDLKVVLNVTDTTLTPEELKLLLQARGSYVRLGQKGWRRLKFDLTSEEDSQLARLGLDAGDFDGEPQRFHALQLADDAAKRFLAPEQVEKIHRRVGELKTRVAPALPAGIQAEMRPYQTEGFHFLAYLVANRFGGVLADDMGLGKTLQTLAWLAWLRESPDDVPPPGGRCALVVCPKSVVDNWISEAARFYPGLRVRRWLGEPAGELASARETADLIVINYPQLRSLSPDIAQTAWLAVILDEAQYIKNPSSQTAQAARALKAGHRLALTGTPIENRLLDLWSILAFSMPGALGNRAQFLRRYNAQDDPLARRRLAARVRPFLLRRTKAQVAKDLPDRVEEDLLCEMEGEQLALYRAELKRARQLLLGLKSNQELNEERFNILTSLLRLRQICCHPALVDEQLREAESAKVAALEDLLEPLMEEGHKVLVFSQFVTMLGLLRQRIEQHGWPHFYLAGDTEDRGELVRKFQSAPGSATFLISLKAGGFGLNLTAASYVVLFDPWWNPAVENQAIDRTHRIGQTSKVMAYRLLMRDSVEQKIRALQKQKAALFEDVLGEERFSQSLTLDDLHFLFAE